MSQNENSKVTNAKTIHHKREDIQLSESFQIPELNDDFPLVIEDFLGQIADYQNASLKVVKNNYSENCQNKYGGFTFDTMQQSFIQEDKKNFFSNLDKKENVKARKKEIHDVADQVFSTLGDTNKHNIEDFISQSGGVMCDFFGKNYMFTKENFWSQELDKQLYYKANRFSFNLPIIYLFESIIKNFQKKRENYTIKIVNLKNKLDLLAYDNEQIVLEHSMYTHANNNAYKNEKWLQKQEDLKKLTAESIKLDGEILKLKNGLNHQYKYITNNMSLEKPFIDISAHIKIYSDFDTDGLFKFLFTMKQDKEFYMGLRESVLIDKIEDLNTKHICNTQIREFLGCMDTLPNYINFQHQSITDEKYYTIFDLDSQYFRIPLVNTSSCLHKVLNRRKIYLKDQSEKERIKREQDLEATLKANEDKDPKDKKIIHEKDHLDSQPTQHNYLEYFIEQNNLSGKFKKFFFNSKLINLTISDESLQLIISLYKKNSYNVYLYLLSGHLFSSSNATLLFEDNPIIDLSILPAISQYFNEYDLKYRTRTIKVQTDFDQILTNADEIGLSFDETDLVDDIVNNKDIVNTWSDYLGVNEDLSLTYYRIDNIFNVLFENQNEYLEIVDYNLPDTKVLLHDLKIDFENVYVKKTKNCKSDNTYSKILDHQQDRLCLVTALWVKENQVFKMPDKNATEYAIDIMLQNQVPHSSIENWFKIILNCDFNSTVKNIEELVEDNQRSLKVKNPENEQSDLYKVHKAYFKLQILNSRSKILKLISYFNFFRAVQKEISIKFIDVMNANKINDEIFGQDDSTIFQKDKLVNQIPMFKKQETEDMNDIFDETKHKSEASLKNFMNDDSETCIYNEDSANYLNVKNMNYEPYMYSNASSGNHLGSSVLKECYGKHLTKPSRNDEDPNCLQEPIKDDNHRDPAYYTRKVKHSQNLFVPELYEFVDISEKLLDSNATQALQEHKRKDYIFQIDANNKHVVYDASLFDFFANLQKLVMIMSFYTQNNFLDKGNPSTYHDESCKERDDIRDEDYHIDKNSINYAVDKLKRDFNYQYFISEIMKKEQSFTFIKARIVKNLLEVSKSMQSNDSQIKIYDFITNFMAIRPDFDLVDRKAMNENIIDMLKKINQLEVESHPVEVQNFLLTIIDNYNNEILYLEKYEELLNKVCDYQRNIFKKVSEIKARINNFDIMNLILKGKNQNNDAMNFDNLEKVVDVMKKVRDIVEHTVTTYDKGQEIDKACFSEYQFEIYYKNHVNYIIGDCKEIDKDSDFLNFINTFMNNLNGRKKVFVKQQIKLQVIQEIFNLWSLIENGANSYDDIIDIKNLMDVRPQNVINKMSDIDFVRQKLIVDKHSEDQILETKYIKLFNQNKLYYEAGKAKIERYNQFFSAIIFTKMKNEIEENLKIISYMTCIYKQQKFSYKKLKQHQKNKKVQEVEDLFVTSGNILKDFLNIDGFYQYFDWSMIQKIMKFQLKNFFLQEETYNNVKMIFHTRTISDYLYLIRHNIENMITSNSQKFNQLYREINEEVSSNLCNKDVVLNQIYNLRIQNITAEVEKWVLEVEIKDKSQFALLFELDNNLVGRKPTSYKKIFIEYYFNQSMSLFEDLGDFLVMLKETTYRQHPDMFLNKKLDKDDSQKISALKTAQKSSSSLLKSKKATTTNERKNMFQENKSQSEMVGVSKDKRFDDPSGLLIIHEKNVQENTGMLYFQRTITSVDNIALEKNEVEDNPNDLHYLCPTLKDMGYDFSDKEHFEREKKSLTMPSVIPQTLYDKQNPKETVPDDYNLDVNTDKEISLKFMLNQLRRCIHFSSLKLQAYHTNMDCYKLNAENEYHPEPVYKFSCYDHFHTYNLSKTINDILEGKMSKLSASLQSLLKISHNLNPTQNQSPDQANNSRMQEIESRYPTKYVKDEENYTNLYGKLKLFMKIPNSTLLHSILVKDLNYILQLPIQEEETNMFLPIRFTFSTKNPSIEVTRFNTLCKKCKDATKKDAPKLEDIEPYFTSKDDLKKYTENNEKNMSDGKTFVTSTNLMSNNLNSALKSTNETNFLAERISNPKYTKINKDGITKYFHNLTNEILQSIRKYYLDEVGGGDNKTSFANLYERPTLEKVLNNLDIKCKYTMNNRYEEIPKYVGYTMQTRKEKSLGNAENIRKTGADNSDDYPIHLIRETFQFKFLTSTRKSVSILKMKSTIHDLDTDPQETLMLRKGCFPFYAQKYLKIKFFNKNFEREVSLENIIEINNLKITSELKNSLKQDPIGGIELLAQKFKLMTPAYNFNVIIRDRLTQKTFLTQNLEREENKFSRVQQASDKFMKGKTHKERYEKNLEVIFGNLKKFLFHIKHVELNFRSGDKIFRKYLEALYKKFDLIREDPKVQKPDLVFNYLLQFEYENSQKLLLNAIQDLMNQVRWLSDYEDIVNESVSKSEQENRKFFYELRNILINLFFPKLLSYEYFYEMFTEENLFEKSLILPKNYNNILQKTKKNKQCFLLKRDEEEISKRLYNKNPLLKIMKILFVQNESNIKFRNTAYWSFNIENNENVWNTTYLSLMSLAMNSKSRLGRKIFEIQSELENTLVNSEAYFEHFSHPDTWLGNSIYSNSTLRLNYQYLLLQEAQNTVEYNKHYSPLMQKPPAAYIGYNKNTKTGGLKADRHMYSKNHYNPSLALPPFMLYTTYEENSSVIYQRNILKILSCELGLTSEITGEDIIGKRYLKESNNDEYYLNKEVDEKLRDVVKYEYLWDDMFSPEKKIIKKNDVFYFSAFGAFCRANITYGTLHLLTKQPTSLITGKRLTDYLTGVKSGKIILTSETAKVIDSILILNNKSQDYYMVLYSITGNNSLVKLNSAQPLDRIEVNTHLDQKQLIKLQDKSKTPVTEKPLAVFLYPYDFNRFKTSTKPRIEITLAADNENLLVSEIYDREILVFKTETQCKLLHNKTATSIMGEFSWGGKDKMSIRMISNNIIRFDENPEFDLIRVDEKIKAKFENSNENDRGFKSGHQKTQNIKEKSFLGNEKQEDVEIQHALSDSLTISLSNITDNMNERYRKQKMNPKGAVSPSENGGVMGGMGNLALADGLNNKLISNQSAKMRNKMGYPQSNLPRNNVIGGLVKMQDKKEEASSLSKISM